MLIVYPLEDFDSLISLEDAIECVTKRNPDAEFLKLGVEYQEGVLVTYTDLIISLYNMPSDVEEEQICTTYYIKPLDCDFKKALCLMILKDCGRGCCENIQSFNNGVTSTSYFDRGQPTLLDDIPRSVQAIIKDCLKFEFRKTIALGY